MLIVAIEPTHEQRTQFQNLPQGQLALVQFQSIKDQTAFAQYHLASERAVKAQRGQRTHHVQVDQILGCPVLRISHMDGFKFYLENDNWVMLRFSGTEALLRIFAEADTLEKAQALVGWGKQLIDL